MNSEQFELSAFIKGIHTDLRRRTSKIGFTEAWKNHLSNEQNLKKYSDAMQLLATSYWEKNFNDINSRASSRVDWVYKFCLEYYKLGETSVMMKQRMKELDIASKMEIEINNYESEMKEYKPTLLDVGSCYNPFSVFDYFSVTAIDIAPACPEVKKVDFINIQIEKNGINCNEFCSEHFDIVLFSLFLEYLPTPGLRLESCRKAYELLKFEGILVIVTPDSKHVGANSKLMKTWQCILAQIGFSRIKYEKLPHIHCMVFRKSLDPRIPERWYTMNKSKQLYSEFFIPQDFNNNEDDNLKNEEIRKESMIDTMCPELPFMWEDTP